MIKPSVGSSLLYDRWKTASDCNTMQWSPDQIDEKKV